MSMEVLVKPLWEVLSDGIDAVEAVYMLDGVRAGVGRIWSHDYYIAKNENNLDAFCRKAVASHGMGFFWSEPLKAAMAKCFLEPKAKTSVTLPPTFLISLRRSTDRTGPCLERLAKHGVKPKLFWGFDGKQLAIDCKHAFLDDHPPAYWEENPPFFVGSGIYALAMGHFAIIKYALMEGYDEVLILEDDVVLCDDFMARYAAVRAKMPAGWGTMHLGWGNVDVGQVRALNDLVAIGLPLQTECVLYSRKAMELIDTKAQLRAAYDVFLYRRIFPEVPSLIAWPEKLARQLSAEGMIASTL